MANSSGVRRLEISKRQERANAKKGFGKVSYNQKDNSYDGSKPKKK
ncbi:MAG: hypothetical protein KAS32_28340 [Candidatus Peribacteraceae bacterium]|nr:hypothetical protein [Candidatus Peribacteraceae bacterium]